MRGRVIEAASILLPLLLLVLASGLGSFGPAAVQPAPLASPLALPHPSVSPVLSLSPRSGPVRTTVTASGTGFTANSQILLAVDGLSVASTCRTDGAGDFPGTTGTACTIRMPVAPAGNVSVTATAVGTVAGVSVGTRPFGVAYDAARGEVFAAASSFNQLALIGGSNDSLFSTVSTGTTSPWAVAVDPARGELFVTSYSSGVVSVFNDTNASVVATIAVGTGPYGIAYDPALGELFVANSGSYNVSVINDTSNSVATTVGVGISPYGVTYDAASGQVFVTNSGGNVSIIDAATALVTGSLVDGSNPAGVAYDPAVGETFVANYLAADVIVINDTTDSVVATIGVGSNPAGVTVDSGLGLVAVANAGSDNVSLIAAATDSVATSVSVGSAPEVIAYDPVQGSLFVSNYLSANVSVIAFAGSTASNFTVNASVSAFPIEGAVGATIHARGSGFAARSTVSLSLAGAVLNGSCSTDGTGSFPGSSGTGCTFVVPALAAGPQNLTASDGTNSAASVFLVLAVLALSPASGTVGSLVNVTGSAYAPSTAISLQVGSVLVASNCATDANGSFPGGSGTSCTFRVPTIPGGATTVVASDGTVTGVANFTVRPSFEVSPHNGSVGRVVSANGTGFAADSAIAFSVAGAARSTSCRTDSTGSFPGSSGTACTFSVPTVPGGNESVSATDASTPRASIGVGAQPFGVAVDAARGEVFAGSSTDDNLTIFYASNLTVVATVALGAWSPWAMAYDPQLGEMFVTSFLNNEVIVLNDTTDSIVATIGVGFSPYGIAYDAGLGEMFVANSGSNSVSVISDSTNSVVATAAVGSEPYDVAYDPAQSAVFVPNSGSDNVSIVSDVSDASIGAIPVAANPTGIAYDPLLGELFVANYLSNDLSVVNDSTDTVVATVGVGTEPAGVSFDAGLGDIFVANAGSDNVSMISPAIDSVVASLPVGSAPEVVASDPVQGGIFVSNYFSANVSAAAFPDRATAGFTVNASLAFVPTRSQADAGQSVTVQGTGFEATTPLRTFSLGAYALACTRATVGTCVAGVLSPDASGAVVATFVLPAVPSSGSYRLTLADPLGDSASLLLTVDTDPTVSSISASPASVDLGQSVTLSILAASGSGSYSYHWLGLPPGCAGSRANVSCTPSATGTFTLDVIVTDSNGFPVVSGSLNFTVFPDPTVTAPVSAPVSGAVDAGQNVTFSTTAAFGSGSYVSFTWSGLPGGCAGTSATVTCPGADVAPGLYSVTVVVTDSNDVASTPSEPLSFAVVSDPVLATPVPSAPSADSGQTLTFSVGVVGGTSPFLFSWSGLPAGCAGLTTDEVTCHVTAPAALTVGASVSDANGFTAQSPVLRLTIHSDPAVAVSVDRRTLDAREAVTLSANATGGTGAYRYAWTGLPIGCPTNEATITCVPEVPGLLTIGVQVTDGNGLSAASLPLDIVVAALPTAAVSVTPNVVNVGETVFFNATGSGGTGPINYTWSFGDGASATGPSVRHAYVAAGQFGVTLWTNDSVGGASSQVVNVSVAAPGSTGGGWTTADSVDLGAGAALKMGAVHGLILWRGSSARRTGHAEPLSAAESTDGASAGSYELDPRVEPPRE